LQLRIMLEDVHPAVWRRLLVPGSVRLDKLHRMFQAAMGWEDRHLHSFHVGDALFGSQFDDYPDDELDEKSITVVRAVGGQRRFAYEYDFGDSCGHEVVVEASWRMPGGLEARGVRGRPETRARPRTAAARRAMRTCSRRPRIPNTRTTTTSAAGWSVRAGRVRPRGGQRPAATGALSSPARGWVRVACGCGSWWCGAGSSRCRSR
jgi:hypothetical protein